MALGASLDGRSRRLVVTGSVSRPGFASETLFAVLPGCAFELNNYRFLHSKRGRESTGVAVSLDNKLWIKEL